MIFQFADKSSAIKHLGIILEVKQVDAKILKIKENMLQGAIVEDLLFYSSEKRIKEDIKRVFLKLDEYTRHVDEMEKGQIGFTTPDESEKTESEIEIEEKLSE